MSVVPEGAIMHYTFAGQMQEAVSSPVSACGMDLASQPDDGHLHGLSPVPQVVNCEACLPLIPEEAKEKFADTDITNLTALGLRAEPPTEGVGGAKTFHGGGHESCSADSPCHGGNTGIRAVTYEGEEYLNRQDVLRHIKTLYTALHAMSHRPENAEAAQGYEYAAQGVDMVGGTLHAITQPGNAVSLEVPDNVDDVLAGWASEQPAAESPIDAAIRKAKEAADEARQATNKKEDGQ